MLLYAHSMCIVLFSFQWNYYDHFSFWILIDCRTYIRIQKNCNLWPIVSKKKRLYTWKWLYVIPLLLALPFLAFNWSSRQFNYHNLQVPFWLNSWRILTLTQFQFRLLVGNVQHISRTMTYMTFISNFIIYKNELNI